MTELLTIDNDAFCASGRNFANHLTNLKVDYINKKEATNLVIKNHYLHRRSSTVYAIGLFNDSMMGVAIFGIPASRHLQIGVCPSDPNKVIELNRLWISDSMPRNTESWFLSKALSLLPPVIVVSYADTAQGHMGYVYRAANFNYAGWTDMDRKTPRYDYISPGRHTRDAFRNGLGKYSIKVRRKPKIRYWTVTGNPTQKRHLRKLCKWPSFSWKNLPPPVEHKFQLTCQNS